MIEELLDVTPEDLKDVAKIAGGYLTKSFIGEIWKKYKNKDAKENTEKLGEMTDKELSNVSEEEIIKPDSHLAVSLLYLNSYTNDDTLRNFFAKLLASSMQKNKSDKAHVSFVRVLEQLSPEEALLIKMTKILDKDTPVAQIRYQKLASNYDVVGKRIFENNELFFSAAEGWTEFNNYLPLQLDFSAESVAFWLDNLERLKLINVTYDSYSTEEEDYASFSNKQLEEKIMAEIEINGGKRDDCHLVYIPGLVFPTMYGKTFYEICVK